MITEGAAVIISMFFKQMPSRSRRELGQGLVTVSFLCTFPGLFFRVIPSNLSVQDTLLIFPSFLILCFPSSIVCTHFSGSGLCFSRSFLAELHSAMSAPLPWERNWLPHLWGRVGKESEASGRLQQRAQPLGIKLRGLLRAPMKIRAHSLSNGQMWTHTRTN